MPAMKAASRYHRRMARFQRLLLLALLLFVAGCATRPAGVSHPPLLLISIDALRPSDVDATQMPTLNALADAGVRAAWMTPSYPSKTFPNHYTLVTGLRPDHHGMINNTMYDPELGSFNLQSREAVQDPRWWTGGEPVWITLQHHGGRAATMFWPGSEAAIQGQHPLDWRIYDESVSANARVDQVLAWLDRPERTRPQFITLYFEQVDEAGHKSGPDSAESRAARKEVDDALARLLAGLEQRGLRDGINLVVVSDHGMANITGREYITDYLQAHGLGLDAIRITTSGALAGITPKPGQEAAVEAALLGRLHIRPAGASRRCPRNGITAAIRVFLRSNARRTSAGCCWIGTTDAPSMAAARTAMRSKNRPCMPPSSLPARHSVITSRFLPSTTWTCIRC